MQPDFKETVATKPAEEESIFDMSEYDMRGYDKHIRNARIVLYLLAGFQVLALAGLQSGMEELAKIITIGLTIALAAFFVGCALYSKKKPVLSITAALIVYSILLVFDIILNTMSIIGFGLIIKAVIVIFLVRGVQNAREIERVRKTFGK